MKGLHRERSVGPGWIESFNGTDRWSMILEYLALWVFVRPGHRNGRHSLAFWRGVGECTTHRAVVVNA